MRQGGPGGRGFKYATAEEKDQRPEVSRALLLRILSWLKPYRGRLLLSLLIIVAVSYTHLDVYKRQE